MIKLANGDYERNKFPDGTLNIKIKYPLEKNYIYSTDTEYITWDYESDSDIFELIAVTEHLRNSGVKDIKLVINYLPYARMDRVKDSSEIFTLKYLCKIINSLNFSKVFILDVHSDVGYALIDRAENLYNKIENGYDNYDLFCFPDNGSSKKYSSIYKDKPYVYCVKNRDWKTGKILNSKLELNGQDIKGKNILIIDDICCKGGTFILAAKALKDEGANKIDLQVSYCEKSIFEGDILKDNSPINKIYTFNTLFDINSNKSNKIIVQNNNFNGISYNIDKLLNLH